MTTYERDYGAEIDALKDKLGTLCNTVEMDIRVELREVKKDLKEMIGLTKRVLNYV